MKRFRITNTGYKIDKLLFSIIMLLLFSGLFRLAYSQNFDFTPKFYIKCTNPLGCDNPFFNERNEYKQTLNILFFIPIHTTKDAKENCIFDWCDDKTIPPGEYGTPQPPIFKYIYLITFVLIGLSILLNHLIHNRKKKFNLGLIEFWKAELKKIGIDTDKIKLGELEDE